MNPTKYRAAARRVSAARRFLRAASAVLGLASVVVPAIVATPLAYAQSPNDRVIYSFTGTNGDGAFPYAVLVQDAAGNLYGTTSAGGASRVGTIFVVNRSGQEKVLYSFTGTNGDGAAPIAGLVQDAAGNFFGTTYAGGVYGNGTVFVVNRSGQEKVLYSFTGTNGDGASPFAGLVEDAAGNFYGTTYAGGVYGNGTVFAVSRSGQEKVLYSFTGTNGDGANPLAGLIRDAAGNLYGTTTNGGAYRRGTAFAISRSGQENVLYSFTGTNGDGANPFAGLIRDAAGNLYGTTEYGGASGIGTIFAVSRSGQEKIVHSFPGSEFDGTYPVVGLIQDAAGNFYGTTAAGGALGCGTIFVVSRSGQYRIIYSFIGGPNGDGQNPDAGLMRDAAGNLYGTTAGGGADGFGTVYELTP
jgi:uncharacterized repeat protein (TIGR03803 family)